VPVLLDEKYARRAARRLGIAVIGTGGFLIRAKRSGAVSQVKPVLDQLRHANYRFSEALLREILRQCGER
ncbi:MAG TPA: DUF3368 domain-containing protein, partial [Bryobacterales bacterium]|nr:DUF3368 domain-containing protein [Bryobacterales bacterium]